MAADRIDEQPVIEVTHSYLLVIGHLFDKSGSEAHPPDGGNWSIPWRKRQGVPSCRHIPCGDPFRQIPVNQLQDDNVPGNRSVVIAKIARKVLCILIKLMTTFGACIWSGCECFPLMMTIGTFFSPPCREVLFYSTV